MAKNYLIFSVFILQKALCRLHGIHTWYFNRYRLEDRAEMLYVMDLSLIREGIFTLKPDELRNVIS